MTSAYTFVCGLESGLGGAQLARHLTVGLCGYFVDSVVYLVYAVGMTTDTRTDILKRIAQIVDQLDAFAMEANHPEIAQLAGSLDEIADELSDLL